MKSFLKTAPRGGDEPGVCTSMVHQSHVNWEGWWLGARSCRHTDQGACIGWRLPRHFISRICARSPPPKSAVLHGRDARNHTDRTQHRTARLISQVWGH